MIILYCDSCAFLSAEDLQPIFAFWRGPTFCGARSLSRKLTTSLLELWLPELTVHEDDTDELVLLVLRSDSVIITLYVLTTTYALRMRAWREDDVACILPLQCSYYSRIMLAAQCSRIPIIPGIMPAYCGQAYM